MATRSMPSGLGRVSQAMQRARSPLDPQFQAGTTPELPKPALSDFYSPGGARGAVRSPYVGPGVTGTPVRATPVGSYNPALTAAGLNINPALFGNAYNPLTSGWNSRTAINMGNIFGGASRPFVGLGSILAKYLGRGIGAVVGDRTLGVQPGMGMPRFMSSGGVTDVGMDYGVPGGYAGYAGGGPDDRGGSVGGSGAADPDRGGFGGENY